MQRTRLKALLFSFSVLFVFALIPSKAIFADTVASGDCGDNTSWTLDSEGTLTISGSGLMFQGGSEFAPWKNYVSDIRSIVFSGSGIHISNGAFSGCVNLTNVSLTGCTVIDSNAFLGCKSLTSIVIPYELSTIGSNAFDGCTSLTSVVLNISAYNQSSFPSDLTDIFHYYYDVSYTNDGHGIISGKERSYGSDIVELIITPDSFYSIDKVTWTDGSTTTELKPNSDGRYPMPDSKTNISIKATFKPVTSGTCGENINWSYEEITSGFTKQGVLKISGSGPMYNWYYSDEVPWNGLKKNIYTVVISGEVTTIGDMAFSGCTYLTDINIPNGVTYIGNNAFSNCSFRLTNITLPNSLTTIGHSAFYCCWSLTSISIPNSVTSIGNRAFGSCTDLTSLKISNQLTTWGEGLFSSCTKLKEVTIPNGVTSIGRMAFEGCSNLSSVTISDSVNTIGYQAFNGCSKLTSITIPDSVTQISGEAFQSCSRLTSISLPNSIESLSYVFRHCSSLKSVKLPAGLKSMGGCFEDCGSLTSIIIPNGVESLGWDTFRSCTSLSSVTIPVSLKTIDTGSFYNCPVLADVYYGGASWEWSRIKIKSNNESLTNANIHYGYYSIHLSELLNGKASLSSEYGFAGDEISIEAIPDEGYELDVIMVNGKPITGTTFKMGDSNATVDVLFKKKIYLITINDTNDGKASASKENACAGEEITIKVSPNTGYELDQITVNDKPINGNKFTMPLMNVTISVTFKKSVFTVSSTQIGNGTVELSKTSACYKDEVTVTATPDSGNKLAYIKVNDEIIQGNTFEMPAKNADIEVAFAKDHKLTFVAAVKPTCTENGSVAYYECQDTDCKCGFKYSDKYGLNEIDSIIDPATGHSPEKVNSKAATCTEKGHIEHWKCSKCGCLFSDSEGKNVIDAKDAAIDALGHDLEHVEAKAETYQKDGHIEYYFCKRENCGKKFADHDAKTELKDEDIIIPRKGAAVLDEEATVDNLIYRVTNPATDGSGTVTLIGVETKTASVSIPSSVEIKESFYNVTRVGSKAFYGNKVLKTLYIGANVKIIDANAFYGCSNLTKVSGGKVLKTIGSSAFAKCSKLKSFSISSPVLSKIGSYAFNKDKKLKTLNIKSTTKLTKAGVKKSLKGSKVKTVKVKKAKVKAYKKIFKKKNSGRTVKVKK